MIESGFMYLAVLAMMAASIVFLEQRIQAKIFKYLPGIVVLYFAVMLFSTFGVWQKTESINTVYITLKTNLLPAMIFLFLCKLLPWLL